MKGAHPWPRADTQLARPHKMAEPGPAATSRLLAGFGSSEVQASSARERTIGGYLDQSFLRDPGASAIDPTGLRYTAQLSPGPAARGLWLVALVEEQVKHLAQRIASLQAEIPCGAYDVSEPSGFFWKSWQSFRCERYILTSLGASVMRFLRCVVAPVFLLSFSHPSCIRQQDQRSARRRFLRWPPATAGRLFALRSVPGSAGCSFPRMASRL